MHPWSITCSSHRACLPQHSPPPEWPLWHFKVQEEVTMGRWCYCCLSIAARLKNNYRSKASYCWHDAEGTRDQWACWWWGCKLNFRQEKKRWITQSSWYVLGFRLEAALTPLQISNFPATHLKKKLFCKGGWVQHLWPTSVAFSMQYMRGALWDIIDKAIKVVLMTGDHDTAPLWCALIK